MSSTLGQAVRVKDRNEKQLRTEEIITVLTSQCHTFQTSCSYSLPCASRELGACRILPGCLLHQLPLDPFSPLPYNNWAPVYIVFLLPPNVSLQIGLTDQIFSRIQSRESCVVAHSSFGIDLNQVQVFCLSSESCLRCLPSSGNPYVND